MVALPYDLNVSPTDKFTIINRCLTHYSEKAGQTKSLKFSQGKNVREDYKFVTGSGTSAESDKTSNAKLFM
jgi:hypothetical protein